MHALVLKQNGGPESLELQAWSRPEPKAGEVLVRAMAGALNHLDLWVRRGLPHQSLPMIVGSDMAGVIEAVGEGVDPNRVGQRVMIDPGLGCGQCADCQAGRENYCAGFQICGESAPGLFATYTAIKSEKAVLFPEDVSWEQAAAFPLTYLTAWEMVVHKAQVQPGDKVLVMAGGSGVSWAAIQIAILHGATVFTTSSQPHKREILQTIDGVEVFDSQDAVKATKNLSQGQGVEVVIDHLGQDTFQSSLRCLKRGGRFVFCGATTGPEYQFDARHIFMKQQSIIGSTMGRTQDLQAMMPALATGRLRPHVDQVLPAAEIVKAHTLLEEKKVFGKVVLDFNKDWPS